MSSSSLSTTRRRAHPPGAAPLSILRTETVLSRFPIHDLTKRGRVTICIQRTNAQGALAVRWDVSYNEHYGSPGPLAYKLDTIVINQLLDALPRPLPTVLKVGSLRHVGLRLDVNDSGRQQGHLKHAFHQNATAYIVAKLRYRGRDGTERRLEAGFTRYSVIFTGEPLPDGTTADAIYLVLSEPYREVLTYAPVRPLDYPYLKALTPTAQHFYEILSYKIFAALTHHRPHATLRYTEYCLLAPQRRSTAYDQVKKQMYKVHQPHIASRYLTQVHYEATTDDDGQPDWLIHYTPGPKARAEYATFMRHPGAEAAAAAALVAPGDDHEDLVVTVPRASPAAPPPSSQVSTPHVVVPAARDQEARLDPLHEELPSIAAAATTPPDDRLLVQAQTLVMAFYQRFYGLPQVTPSSKELAHATELLAQHGEAKAHFLLAFAHQAAPETHYQPQTLGGIRHYLPRALAAYDAQTARATHAATQRAAADERTQREQYLAWEQRQLEQLRAALPPAELAALDAEARGRLVAEGKPEYTLRGAVRVAVDTVLARQAGLPPFEVWRQTQEAGGTGTSSCPA